MIPMQQMVIKWIPLQIYFLFRPPACRRAWEDFVGEEQGARVQLEAAAGGHRRPSTGDWGEDGRVGDGHDGHDYDSHGLVNFTNPLAAFQVRQGTFLVMVMVIMVVLAMVMMVTPDGKQRTLRSVIFMVIIPQTLLVVKLLCNSQRPFWTIK